MDWLCKNTRQNNVVITRTKGNVDKNGVQHYRISFTFKNSCHKLFTTNDHMIVSMPTENNRIYFKEAPVDEGFKICNRNGCNPVASISNDRLVNALNGSHLSEFELQKDNKEGLYYIQGHVFN